MVLRKLYKSEKFIKIFQRALIFLSIGIIVDDFSYLIWKHSIILFNLQYSGIFSPKKEIRES